MHNRAPTSFITTMAFHDIDQTESLSQVDDSKRSDVQEAFYEYFEFDNDTAAANKVSSSERNRPKNLLERLARRKDKLMMDEGFEPPPRGDSAS